MLLMDACRSITIAEGKKVALGLVVTEVTMIEPTYKYIALSYFINSKMILPILKRCLKISNNEIHKYDDKVVAFYCTQHTLAIRFPETPQWIGPK